MKKIVELIAVLAVATGAYGQSTVWKNVLLLKVDEGFFGRAFVEESIVPSESLTRQILEGMNSAVGSKSYNHALQLEGNIQWLGNNLATRIARLAYPNLKLTKVDGYIRSFPKELKSFEMALRRDNLIPTLLQQYLYDYIGDGVKEARFSGAFLPNLKALEYASQFSLQMGTFDEAFEKAYADATAAKSGFFVIAEHPRSALQSPDQVHRVKDLYILDLQNRRWISYNQSKALAWREISHSAAPTVDPQRGAKVERIKIQVPQLFQLNQRDGAMASYTNEFVVVSNGDDLEMVIPSTFQRAKEALAAYDKGYYIYLFKDDKGTTKMLFAAKKGYPLFNTVKETEYYLKQRQERNSSAQSAKKDLGATVTLDDAKLVQKQGDQNRTVQTPFGELRAHQYLSLSNDGITGVLVYKQEDMHNIYSARQYLDSNNNMVDRENPFKVRITTWGEAIPLQEEARKVFNLQSVYPQFSLQYYHPDMPNGPFFNTVAELEKYLKETQKPIVAAEEKTF